MDSRGVGPLLQKRVAAYFDQNWRCCTIFDEQKILSELPSFLRDEIVKASYSELIYDVPLFATLPPSLLSMVVQRMQFESVLPTQRIVTKGGIGDSLYICIGGLVVLVYGDYDHGDFELDATHMKMLEVATRVRPGIKEPPFQRNEVDESTSDLVSRGDLFCEYTCLFGIPPPHHYTAVALERSMLLSLPKQSYNEIIGVFPQLRTLILRCSSLNDKVQKEVATHLAFDATVRMSGMVDKMVELADEAELRHSQLATGDISAKTVEHWNPLSPAEEAMVQATAYRVKTLLQEKSDDDGEEAEGGASVVSTSCSATANLAIDKRIDALESIVRAIAEDVSALVARGSPPRAAATEAKE